MTEKSGGAPFRLFVKQASYEWEFKVERSTFTLGRTDISTVTIPIQLLSAIHLEFTHVKENTWSIVDKKSTNGTSIGSVPMLPGKAYQVKFPAILKVGKNTELSIKIESLSQESVVEPEKPVLMETKKVHDSQVEDEQAKDLARDLILLEAKVAQAKNAEQLYSVQSKEAQKVFEENEKQRKEEERRLAEIKCDYDQKQKELYEISQRLESQRREFEEKEKGIRVMDGDLKDYDNKLSLRSEEVKEADYRLVEIQRKISGYIDQEKDIKKNIETLKADAEVYKTERELRYKDLSEIKKELEAIVQESAEKKAVLDEFKETYTKYENRLKETLHRESEAHSEIQKSQHLIAAKEADALKLTEKIESLHKQAEEKRVFLDQILAQIESLRKVQVDEERERATLSAKLVTVKEAFLIADTQRKANEAALESVRTEIVAAESKLKRLSADTQENELKLASFQSELAAKEKHRVELEAALHQLHETQKSISNEYHERNEVLRKEMESFEQVTKEKVESELAAQKAAYSEWEKSEKEKFQKQYSQQGEKFQRDMAEKKQKELQLIEAEREKWNKERDARRPLEIKEILRSMNDLLGVRLQKENLDATKIEALRNGFKRDAEDVLKAVLSSGKDAQVQTHLKNMLVQSPEQTLKAKKERKIWAAQLGSVALLVLLGILFPQIPRSIINAGKEAITREPQSSSLFVERIRQARANRPKFMPTRDRVYRDTYTDNLIYLADYSEIKNDEELKKAWTLALNKFFLQKLELDEKAIVTFVGIEAPLVKELSDMSSKIQLQTQEIDIANMKAFEEMTTTRLMEAVKGEANYKKLRQFENDFYKDYSSKIKE